MQEPFREGDGGVYLPVRVQPRAKESRLVQFDGTTLRVRLTAPPVDNAANEVLRKLVADQLQGRIREVQLIRGMKGRDKLLFLEGLTKKDVENRIRHCLSPAGC